MPKRGMSEAPTERSPSEAGNKPRLDIEEQLKRIFPHSLCHPEAFVKVAMLTLTGATTMPSEQGTNSRLKARSWWD
jgi:hypothetical protein